MKIEKLNVSQLKAAEYNPRKDLSPNDAEYEKLKNSIEAFQYVEPIVWNERTGRIVSGHQRLKVLIELGETDIDVSVINVDEKDEKLLNVILNKVRGRWDNMKLPELLEELNEVGKLDLTGFEEWELQSLLMQYDHIKDLMEEDFSDYGSNSERQTFTMTFSFPADAREAIEGYLKNTENAKQELATIVINKVKGTFDDDN